ncbi:hypothetical protein QQF64_029382 [Cirrhinus molitorella]|uniref:Sterile alpha motif domain-containing protein 9-like n=1 Tax=Cirrhinus molitorella TaxID=172907 RepID=A0ABR3N0K4_9TELE
MFETDKVNPDVAKYNQINFLKGAPPKWLNFYPENIQPLVERDGFNDLIQLIEKRKGKRCLITDVSLRYQSGSGGSTLAMQVLWRFRKDLRCARVIDSDLDTKELSKQVVDLFLMSNDQHHPNRRTVLLLLDTKEKINDQPVKNVLWENLLEEMHKRDINTKTPAVIILNCSPTDFTLKDTLILPPNLSEEARKQFKEKLLQQIRLQRKGHWKVTIINLFHHKDSGGSTLAREVLSDLREEFTCETLTNPFKTDMAENKDEFEREIENIGKDLLGKRQNKTLLLLLDHEDDKPLRYLIKNLQLKLQHPNRADHPAFIIINAVSKSAVRAPGDVKLKMELLPEEQEKFAQKNLEIKQKYKKMSHNLHSFNIMQRGFQKEDAEKMITEEMVKHVEDQKDSCSTRLLSFLALINAYVPGSHLAKPLCKKFIEQEWSDEEKPSLEMIMKPFQDLMVTFSEGEQKADRMRLAHPMIADACLKMLTEHSMRRSDIAQDFLNSMVKGKEERILMSNYEKTCKSMLVTRPKGLVKEKFSILILDIIKENKTIPLLKLASECFFTDPFYPQTLARLYYIEEKGEHKYVNAEKWAKVAIERDNKNSHIRDTLGQVHKNHLLRIWNQRRSEWWKVEKPCTDIKTRLIIAEDAIKAFDDEEKAAKDELATPKTKYNNRGRFGFLQVCKEIYDLKNPEINPVEQKHLDFINGHRRDVERKYDFFEWYLAFSKPSVKEEDPDYFHRDVDDCYNQYFSQTLNEKKKKSFGGLLYFLKSDISVCKQHLSSFEKPQSENETQIVLYILANIILSQFGEPCEKTERLQNKLQKLWFSREQGRSPEFYLLILLLFWPDEAQNAKTNPPDLEECVQYMSQSYEKTYGEYLHGRYLVPLFFLGKGRGLKRLVHALKTHKKGLQKPVQLHQSDLELLTEGDESVEVEYLQRINGKVEDHKVFAVVDEQQIQVTPHDRASVCKLGQVSFYLGFNIRGPVAYNIRYEGEKQKTNGKSK